STSAITSFLTPLSITPHQNATIRAKKKRGRPGDAVCTRRTSLTAGAYAPVTTALPAGSIPDAPHPTKPPAPRIYPPGRRRKCARFHAHGGPAGLSCCWNSASGTPTPSAPAVPGAPHNRPRPSCAGRLPGSLFPAGPSSVRSTPVLPARPGSSAAPPACAWGRSSLRLLFLIDGGFFLRLFSGARLLFQLAADRGAALAQLFGTVLAGQDGDIGAGQFLHAGDRQTAERQQRHQLVMGLGACAGQKVWRNAGHVVGAVGAVGCTRRTKLLQKPGGLGTDFLRRQRLEPQIILPRLAQEQIDQAGVAVHHKVQVAFAAKAVRVGRDVHRPGPRLVGRA